LKVHTLEKGWFEKDNLLIHAAFQILVDFVENEKPDQILDWNSDLQVNISFCLTT
jgi:hypothetical protein